MLSHYLSTIIWKCHQVFVQRFGSGRSLKGWKVFFKKLLNSGSDETICRVLQCSKQPRRLTFPIHWFPSSVQPFRVLWSDLLGLRREPRCHRDVLRAASSSISGRLKIKPGPRHDREPGKKPVSDNQCWPRILQSGVDKPCFPPMI